MERFFVDFLTEDVLRLTERFFVDFLTEDVLRLVEGFSVVLSDAELLYC